MTAKRATESAAGEDVGAADRTRQLVIDAAHDCIHRFGIRRTSMQEVARYARVSRGSVYRYFADKESLVAEVFLQGAQRNRARCEEIAAEQSNLTDEVAEIAVWMRERALGELFFHLDQTEPETLALLLTARSDAIVETWVEFWVPRIQQAKAAGEVRPNLDLQTSAEWIARAVMSLVLGKAVTFDVDDPKQLRKYIRDHVVRGLQ